MKTLELKRWISLTAIDHLVVEVPDDWTVDEGNPYDHLVIRYDEDENRDRAEEAYNEWLMHGGDE